jgi:hypothetical protein
MVSPHLSRRLFVATTAVVTVLCSSIHSGSLLAAPPMSREDFIKAVPRGLPKEQVITLLGKPSQERENEKDGLTELTYKDQVLSPKTGRPEAVTVVIYDEYKTVQSVRWADGTVAEQ